MLCDCAVITSNGFGVLTKIALMTSCFKLQGFDELLELATKGRHQNVDMLVSTFLENHCQ